MSISVREQYHAAVIEIKGKFLGSVDGPEFKEQINALKEKGQKQVVVDLAEADFMDSSGVGTLISGLTSMRNAGGDMRLANMEKGVRDIFLITRLLGPVFENHESVEEALQSFEE